MEKRRLCGDKREQLVQRKENTEDNTVDCFFYLTRQRHRFDLNGDRT